MPWTVSLHGVRGSLPTPYSPQQMKDRLGRVLKHFLTWQKKHPHFHGEEDELQQFIEDLPREIGLGYGGNTIAVEIRHPSGDSLLIDGGSGLRNVDASFYIQKKEVHLLMTHFHWDHLLGLPFFAPLYIPDTKIHFYAVQPDLEENIRQLFCRPFFPVSFESLRSTLQFHQLAPRKAVIINGFQVTPYALDHPDPCWGFKITRDGKSYAHCVDHEAKRTTPQELGPDEALFQNLNLMVIDTQYSVEEAKEKRNWGHGTVLKALEMAIHWKCPEVVFIHHDPLASDDHIAEITEDAFRHLDKKENNGANHNNFSPHWIIGHEGLQVTLK